LYLHPTLADTDLVSPRLGLELAVTPLLLADLTDRVAGAAERWRPVLRHDPERRWFTRLLRTDTVEVWLLGWTPGQQVPAHDHGGAAGAFTVVDGALVEDQLDSGSWAPGRRTSFPAGSRAHFGPDHAHVLGNRGDRPATSVHAYSPPGLPLRFAAAATRTVDQLLDRARARLRRLDPRQAAAVAGDGGLLVDIRPAAQRQEEGEIPGAIVVERNVLEWRLDPASPHRLAEVRSHDQPIVVLCSEGYTSSLAAASLQDVGLRRATDLAGGFKAWAAAGLPVAAGGSGR
jgi:rhodanese-related sulfurtransferase